MKKTIKKVLDELAKDKPDLSYIRGMLEVLMDEDEPKPIMGGIVNMPAPMIRKLPDSINTQNVDEGAMLDTRARESLKTIKEIANESVQEN